MRYFIQLLLLTVLLFLTGCSTDSQYENETVTDQTGTLIWGGSPAVDGTGLLLETADTTYGASGSYEDYESYFPENENSVEVIADFLITGEETTRGWGVKLPEIRLIDVEVSE